MANIALFGATSRIAQDVAQRYADRGDQLFLVGRNPEKLEALVKTIGAAVVGHVSTDLDRTDHSAELVAQAHRALGAFDVFLIAHGLLPDQLETEADYAAAEKTIRTNFLSPVSLLIPAVNLMEDAGSGHLAVMSSVAGERGRPRNYTYGSAKGALTLYLQGLRSRLYESGVSVHTLKLGPTHTPMTVDHPKNALFATPERVAQDIVHAIARGESEAFIPWYWRPIMTGVKNLPEPLFQQFPFLSGR